jgi:hypothetical protein
MLIDYLDVNLAEELNLDSLPDDKKQELTEQMTSTLSARLNREVLNRLTEEQKQQLDDILDRDGDVAGFIEEVLPNFDAVAGEVVARFKRDILEAEEQIRSKVNAS